jgi:hypothetical protein
MPKKQTKKPSVPPENIAHNGAICLSPIQRLTLMQLASELKALDAENALQQKNLNDYLKAIDPKGLVGTLQSALTANQAHRKVIWAKYEEARDSIGKALKIDMKGVSFDYETGIVHQDKGEPAKPEDPKK